MPNFSKIYERCFYNQMCKYPEGPCGFCKVFSTQQCLFAVTEKWQKCLDKRGTSGAILANLSKAFDCILHNLWWLGLLTVLTTSISESEKFLSNRQQITKINYAFSCYSAILYGVLQKSQFWVPFFNFYIFDIFCRHNWM